MRHVLIEHIQKNEIYVSNDLELGKSKDGIMLYGTNAVGKSSLIKSIGICIIMAQSQVCLFLAAHFIINHIKQYILEYWVMMIFLRV